VIIVRLALQAAAAAAAAAAAVAAAAVDGEENQHIFCLI